MQAPPRAAPPLSRYVRIAVHEVRGACIAGGKPGYRKVFRGRLLPPVSEKGQEQLPDAVFHARAVMDVLMGAVPEGEVEQIKGALPEEYKGLFEGAEGRMNR